VDIIPFAAKSKNRLAKKHTRLRFYTLTIIFLTPLSICCTLQPTHLREKGATEVKAPKAGWTGFAGLTGLNDF
jgi:hypothetical protein